MATKTWKIGECCKGGIITVVIKHTKITIIGKEWDYTKGSNRGSNQSGAKEWTRLELQAFEDDAYRKEYAFLSDLTTHFYAERIIDWIEEKIGYKTKSYFLLMRKLHQLGKPAK